MQLELDFTNKGWRRWAIDRCTRLRTLTVTEGGRPIRLNGSEAKILLYKIAEYDDCYASVGRLSDETGITKRNIERLIKAMRESGLMKVEPRPSDRGHFPTNRYIVFYSELAAETPFFLTPPSATPSATPSAMPTATPSAMVADNKEIKKQKRKNSSCKSKKPRNSNGTTYQPASTEAEAEKISFGEVSFEEIVSLCSNHGVGSAERLITSALSRGCSLRSIKAIIRWFELYRRKQSDRWRKPASVLMIRIQNSTPGVPAWKGWIPGSQPRKEIPF